MANKIFRYVSYFLAAGMLLSSCTKEDVFTFDDQASVYFYRNQYNRNDLGAIQYDSVSYSFFLAGSAQTATVWLQVELTGELSSADRPINVIQSNAGETGAAVAGTHYIAFNDPEVAPYMVMPANSTKTYIPVILTRTTTMDDGEFKIVIELAPNAHFTTGIERSSKGQDTFIVNVTARVAKPVTWDSNYNYTFGEWGPEKMKFLIDYVNFTDFEIDMANLDNRYYWNLKAKAALADYEAEFGELYEEDGYTKVTIP